MAVFTENLPSNNMSMPYTRNDNNSYAVHQIKYRKNSISSALKATSKHIDSLLGLIKMCGL